MSCKKRKSKEAHLRVYANRSEYHSELGSIEIHCEGVISDKSKKRIKLIKDTFGSGYLDDIILTLKANKDSLAVDKISPVAKQSLNNLVDLMTSEVGRALIGLSVMQLSIKAIAPQQNIRLHKGSSSRGSFSWVEGVSMRTLDKSYVTPTMRRHGLLRLNADGFMMTRSLAENYPYSALYKAQLRGAKTDWLNLVEELESGATDPLESLKYFLSLLLNAADEFANMSQDMLTAINNVLPKFSSKNNMYDLMVLHTEKSDYAARLFEVSMHALAQAAVESGAMGDIVVKPLCQMRSANKKHGNIGDVELMEDGEIIESWDAKYGKSYLREELEELLEKLVNHENVQTVGFVTNATIERPEELERRIDDITSLHDVKIMIVQYKDWVNMYYERCLSTNIIDEIGLSRLWVVAYAESLAQKRRKIAPIDEPCYEWVKILTEIIESM